MRTVETYLFVGGPSDGKRARVLHGEDVIVSEILDHADYAPQMVRHTYRRVRLGGKETVFSFFMHSAMNEDQALERLFEHYQP